jgi:hypothetical protein
MHSVVFEHETASPKQCSTRSRPSEVYSNTRSQRARSEPTAGMRLGRHAARAASSGWPELEATQVLPNIGQLRLH